MLDDSELSETFDLLDVDKDGQLTRAEIAALLRTVKVDPTRIELDFIFSEMDTSKTGKICKEEFVKYMRSPPINRITIGELEQQFKTFDRDGDGAITEEELEEMLAETADLHDKEAVEAMFHATDTNNDGRITFIEFVKMMRE